MRTRLTERDLSRIVRRVIYEETPVNDGEDWSQDNYVFTARYEENNDPEQDRKSTRLNSSHVSESRMPSSA